MKQNVWQLQKPLPQTILEGQLGYSPIILQLLYNRGLLSSQTTASEIDEFLNPSYSTMHDPLNMLGIKMAVEQIVAALKQEKKICIFGDYDVDGITATAILYETLTGLGAEPFIYFPTREAEGYGLNRDGLEKIKQAGIDLVITVDCGSNSSAEIAYAQEIGLALIITDHHLVTTPESGVVRVNPHQEGCAYPNKELCGAGVAWKLAQAILRSSNPQGTEAAEKWLLDLVALGTFCDMVPLVGENRVLAHFGLKVLQKTKRPGLLKLFEQAGINPSKADAYTCGYYIGPRLNAAARMSESSPAQDLGPRFVNDSAANISLALLVTKDTIIASACAKLLDELNLNRQAALEEALQEAKSSVASLGQNIPKLLVVAGTWAPGIVGLVAGRLKEEYSRPVLALSCDGVHATGSARSIDEFHMVNALSLCSAHLIRFGGHSKAAGFRLKQEDIGIFSNEMMLYAEEALSGIDLQAKTTIDLELKPEQINPELVQTITAFGPHGLGNPKPVFVSTNVPVYDFRVVGAAQNHLQLVFKVAGGVLKGIGFRLAELAANLKIGSTVDVVYNLEEDEYLGKTETKLKIIDFKIRG